MKIIFWKKYNKGPHKTANYYLYLSMIILMMQYGNERKYLTKTF